MSEFVGGFIFYRPEKMNNLSRDQLFTGRSFSSFLNSSETKKKKKENKLNVLLLDK